MSEPQTIQARHGVATFVPAGQVIKIINTSGGQVVDTWAFALPKPTPKSENEKSEKKEEEQQQQQAQQKQDEEKNGAQEKPAAEEEQASKAAAAAKATPKKGGNKKDDMGLPSQEEAEKATKDGIAQAEEEKGTPSKNGKDGQKKGWSSYVPSIGWRRDGKGAAASGGSGKEETQQQKDSKTWGAYFPSGKGFSSYIPKTATDTVSAFATTHQRDMNKSYIEQLQEFSKTPVGAAGLSAITGSGYAGSLYAGYSAWNLAHAPDAPPMEFMSMPHTRAATLHLRPQVNDVLVSNMREPMLTFIEDKSSGIHDTLIAACDPQRYKGLGVSEWEKHGSCAENLVLALKELNERAGLKGAKGVGADVTVNNVPAPLNLFMNIPWDQEGEISFNAPKSKEGDYVRMRAERDIVVVMSACPQDVLDINNKKPTDAHFIVEEDTPKEASQAPKKRPAPRKLQSGYASTVATGDLGDDDKSRTGSTPAAKKPVPKRVPVKKAPQQKPQPAGEDAAAPAKKPAAPPAAAPKKKPVPAQPAQKQEPKQEAGNTANGAAKPPVEKKKPRKLNAKPKEAPKETPAAE